MTSALDCSFQQEPLSFEENGLIALRQIINPVEQTVTVEAEYATTNAWVGFAFVSGFRMFPNTAVIGIPSTNTVLKYALTAYATPLAVEDNLQTLTNTSVVVNGDNTTLRFTKPLMENGEVPIVAGQETGFMFAYGVSENLVGHTPTTRIQQLGTTVIPQCVLDDDDTLPPSPVTTTNAPIPAPTLAPTNAAAGGDVIDLGNRRFQQTITSLRLGHPVN